jgi:hypothetical protein
MKSTTTHKTPAHECCRDAACESGLRNNYFEGKRLTVDSFRVEQKYSLERRHLLNRAIYGWGVVYGFAVKSGPAGAPIVGKNGQEKKPAPRNQLNIGAGLALDICGRELLQTDQATVASDLIVVDRKERIDLKDALKSGNYRGMCWLLSVHYAEQYKDHVTIEDSCRCEHDEWDHTCETVRYSLRPVPCGECCNDFPCELECDCGAGPCCDEHRHPPVDQKYPAGRDYADKLNYVDRKSYRQDYGDKLNPADTRNRAVERCRPGQRGGCRCLCDHLIKLPQPECKPLCEIEEPCGRLWVDLENGVPLACVVPEFDDCDRLEFREVEECGPRRLVKRNDLLFDLLRGCDLTRMIEIGWADWHRSAAEVPFEEFSNALGPVGQRQDQYITNKFWVKFSRPVRQETVRADCFAMTILSAEREGGWWLPFRVPIVGVDTGNFPAEPHDPPNHVRGATIIVDGPWLEDAVRGRRTLFLGGETRVEIEVRGDLMIDCNGQQLDLETHGLCPAPTGNNSPGGTFFSDFVVASAREASTRPVKYQSGDPREGVPS